jgi:hypothetical protein
MQTQEDKITLTVEQKDRIRDYLSRGGCLVLFNEKDQEIYKSGGSGRLLRTLTYKRALEIIESIFGK